MKKRIYYHDTDCGGVVYYANYLKFMEEARTEYLEQRGLAIKDLIEKDMLFVVYRQEIDYKYPSFYGDTLELKTKVNSASEIRVEFEYEIRNQDNRITTKGKTVLVCVDKNLHPKTMPVEMREALMKPL